MSSLLRLGVLSNSGSGDPEVLGVKIDRANSNPYTAVTYTDGATGLQPSTNVGTTFTDNGWQDRLEDIVGMRPCLFKNGAVQYYLYTDDFTKKADSNVADITSGLDGDVMIQFNHCWTNISYDADYVYVKISKYAKNGFSDYPFSYKGVVKNNFYVGVYDGSGYPLHSLSGKTPKGSMYRSEFRSYAQTNGTGYEILPYNKLMFLQILYLLRFKSLDCQSALGRGYVDASSGLTVTTGTTNTHGMCYGNTIIDNVTHIKCNGIEDLWGNADQWVDGISTNASKHILLQDGNFTDLEGTDSGAIPISDYLTNVFATNTLGFLPSLGGGSTTTYYCDFSYNSSSKVAKFGGSPTSGDMGGLFNIQIASTTTSANGNIGARLCYCG